jgi:hypothetical protein
LKVLTKGSHNNNKMKRQKTKQWNRRPRLN